MDFEGLIGVLGGFRGDFWGFEAIWSVLIVFLGVYMVF
jgi:hypothetical protein